MVVGLIAVILLAITVGQAWPNLPDDAAVLTLIGQALALAAAIELAYALFTDGPDEVLDPLMLGLSAAILLQLAKVEEFSLTQAAALATYAVGLTILFSARHMFISSRSDAAPWFGRGSKRKRLSQRPINYVNDRNTAQMDDEEHVHK